MINEKHVVVIGGGFAGLIAAAAAVKRGKKVALIAKGAGTVTIGSGTIDILGYLPDGLPIKNPKAGLTKLPLNYPYVKCGLDSTIEAVEFFKELAASEGYPLTGNIENNLWLPTAIGTLKPSCLIPETLNPEIVNKAKKLVVVSFDGLKDHFSKLLVKEVSKLPGFKIEYDIITISTGIESGRDLTVIDIARWLEIQKGQESFVEQLKKKTVAGTVVLLPAVLGTKPNYSVVEKIKGATGCNFLEMLGIPPGVTGYRLRQLVIKYLHRHKVNIIENAIVSGAVVQEGRCIAIKTGNIDRERIYKADAFILATGGFLGGGLLSGPGFNKEVIFDLPLSGPADQAQWGHSQLYAKKPQPFAQVGISVNTEMRPVGPDNQVVIDNVFAAGKIIAGYDFCFEKSGNSVALVSGYKAGISV